MCKVKFGDFCGFISHCELSLRKPLHGNLLTGFNTMFNFSILSFESKIRFSDNAAFL